ncbi:MAG: SH3 domain-containing protein [Anaerolineales bacterium]|nr:SH3 domain-containing protein [Anaerolineales bacterium]
MKKQTIVLWVGGGLFALLVVILTLGQPLRAQQLFPATVVVQRTANLRSGPGTGYALIDQVEPGTTLTVVGSNSDGTWYRLDDGGWIAAFLVAVAPPVVAGSQPITTGMTLSDTVGLTDTAPLAPVSTGAFTTAPPGSAPASPASILTLTAAISPTEMLIAALPTGVQPALVTELLAGNKVLVQIDAVTTTVAYLGVNAPSLDAAGGGAALEANRALVENRTVYLLRDQTDQSADAELLRYVFLADGTFVNAQLLANGWAIPATSPTDVAQANTLAQAALTAAKQRNGFWRGPALGSDVMSLGLTLQPTTVYAGLGASNPINGNLAAETSVNIRGRTEDGAWVQVTTPDALDGWVFVAHLLANMPIGTLPVTVMGPSGPTPVPIVATAPTVAAPDAALYPGATLAPDAPLQPVPVETPVPAVTSTVPAGPPISLRQANLRGGPGTDYPVVGTVLPDTVLTLTGRNAEGTWYQLTGEVWIAAFLVGNAPALDTLPIVQTAAAPPPTAVVVVPPGGATPTPTATTTPMPTPYGQSPLPSPTPFPGTTPVPQLPSVRILDVDKGAEVVILYNDGNAPQDLTGWTLFSEQGAERCPLSGTIEPRGTVRVWATVGPDGLSCGFGTEIWNNSAADAAVLLDANGATVSRLER